jgi:hypothetical protein
MRETMRGAIVESSFPAASSLGYGAWLTTALRERERRVRQPRTNAVGRGSTGQLAEPSIDGAACAAWLAAAPARDKRETSR